MKENKYSGILIVVEGADGAGTTTQSKKLAEEIDAHWTAEPTENPVGEKIQQMIRTEDYSPEAIGLAFAADRMLHLEEEVIPELKKGNIVVSDRYYHSSFTYQPALGADFEWVKKINESALRPDLTIVIDLDAEEALQRIEERSDGATSEVVFEELDFESEVIQRYRRLGDRLNEEIKLVDGSGSIEEVFTSVESEVMNLLD